MTTEHVEVAIIGGGPGGLTLAQGLKKNSISVAVFEKDRARTDYVQGFRLRIRQRGIDSLIANLPPELYDAFVATLGQAPDRNILLDENFKILGEDAAWGGGNALGEADDTHIEKSVSRITLRQVLLSGLDGIVRYGKVFSRYDEQPDGSVVAHFEDGSTIHADVLVGADGARSRVRQQLVPHARSFDTGVRRLAGKMTLHAAALHQISPLLLDYNAGVRPTEGHGLMVTSHRVNVDALRKHGLIGLDDATHKDFSGFHFNNTTSYVWWNTAYEKDELATDDALAKLSGSELIDLLISKIAHWHPEILDLIRYTDPSTVALLHVHSSEPVDPWPTKPVTLLGDAIHAMTYFRALGGNTSIYDAGLLVPELVAAKRGGKPLLQALSEYEAKMLEHGAKAVRSSLTAMQKNVLAGRRRQSEAAE
ncbi:FAD-dependent monooxygenase [Mesorhizobium sp. M0902]|uniref:FAD-dependent oxidoreductase n=1 Tax=unclassified Mesorhizobium TaxID=325217 RepID=UPI0033367D98